MHAVVGGTDPTASASGGFAHFIGCAPFWPLTRLGKILPHLRARRIDVEFDHLYGVASRNQVSLAVFFIVPCSLEVAHPALHIPDDVDHFLMCDETLRHRIDPHRPDAG